jgi:hypothetical protein
MKIGQQIDFVRDNLPPLKSPNTDLVSAWLTCGGQLLEEDPYSWTVEDTNSGPQQTVTWCMDGGINVKFGAEVVNFGEFRRRWLSPTWCVENPDHPISYMRLQRDNMAKMKAWIKTLKPAVLIRRGGRVAVIHPDLPEAKKNKILAEL